MKRIAYVSTICLSCFMIASTLTLQIRSVDSQKMPSITQDRETNELRDQLLKLQEKYNIKSEATKAATSQLEQIREKVATKDAQLEELNNQISTLNNVAGFSDVTGPGIIVTVMDSKINTSNYLSDQRLLLVHYSDILMIVNELNNAGAQAISINGERIVSTSAINCSGNIITVNNKKVGSPFEIKAIGNINQLLNLNRPNGYLSIMKKDGLEVSIKQDQNLKIDKYGGVIDFKYAKTIK